ncbi:MAG: Nramp family divalent metal transporter [Pirellulales bacterium]|nr:Nramp family divalent metal transporter [Pirellulales bacterium]
MIEREADVDPGETVPDSVIPRGQLPPLRWRDLPDPVPLKAMIGPSVMLAGLALGSGELILWPYITYKTGFIFFWACVLGVTTQYFVNLEIERWTLATGESAITGFCRQSRHWAGAFLFLNVVPWMIPAWAKGGASIVCWLIWPETAGTPGGAALTWLSIGGLVLCGLVLTAGPVVYETVEKIQLVLVSLIMVIVVILAAAMVRADAVGAMLAGLTSVGQLPPFDEQIHPGLLLGALAFAGAGGTLNLGQSNYIKDKGYGMGRYIGRITSPITGREEPVAEFGYHFPHTPENLARWRQWWRATCIEHFLSFFVTCIVCLTLLTLLAYSIFYEPDGTLKPGLPAFKDDLAFVWAEAQAVDAQWGGIPKFAFLLMGLATLLTTEFGVLDLTSRISTDIVKVNWLEDQPRWSESRLYYLFLWGTIAMGALILLVGEEKLSAFAMFKLSSGLNGAVMFLYCATLLYLNRRRLPADLRTPWWRALWLAWGILFYGGFAAWVVYELVAK